MNVVFYWLDVGFWLNRYWILVVWTLDFVCMDVGVWIFVGWMLDFDLFGR